MKALKKLSVSLAANFEKLVDDIENHEALVNEAITQVKAALGRVRVQKKTIERNITNLRVESCQLEKSIELWRERGRIILGNDKAMAKECAQKVIKAQDELHRIEKELEVLMLESSRVEKEEKHILDKLLKLEQRKRELVCREGRITATRSFQGETEGMLERWENKLIREEALSFQETLEVSENDKAEEYFTQSELKSRVDQELESFKK